VKEARQAESRQDFIHKMSVALQRASETEYWIELLRDTDFINLKTFNSLNDGCAETFRFLTPIVKTSKQNR
jgi:four helix bundle protein